MNKKYLKLFILVSFAISFYENGFSQNLRIEVFNKTGFDIESTVIENKNIGLIKSNSSIIISDCRELTIIDGLPLELPFGVIKGKKWDESGLGLCGTGSKSVSAGEFKFDIVFYEREKKGYKLFWKKHE